MAGRMTFDAKIAKLVRLQAKARGLQKKRDAADAALRKVIDQVRALMGENQTVKAAGQTPKAKANRRSRRGSSKKRGYRLSAAGLKAIQAGAKRRSTTKARKAQKKAKAPSALSAKLREKVRAELQAGKKPTEVAASTGAPIKSVTGINLAMKRSAATAS